ncbi:bifunctional DedA family/phosphatase PAP2 family protein [Flavobacterium sp. MXW15]|uniref:Bifunctional DedA family/phosphatase PAP2 family protein n=1 Tax=Xanthomonas chitinilytica TaxID=2989819 RepID=A0ABT3JTJ9_9XANT|nr:bifunctional DedA family/phosphatase PAP2 family protein [Xanthomonas sp. H13-6]MCW4454585.1 bifunctional DedA family/phosphatase PAP2 family protein [Flavobacterium sp. MXW15]MCW4471824.1 bifunctional DedA family/phosphatase PAP2 family protein [Xanthomonas sp. H13-6]
MNSSWIDATLAWIAAHPVLAGAVIFAIAFCDAVIVLGAIVPALPLMIAVGVLIGLDQISGPYAVACAALGAFVGDGLSYWVGRRWGNRLRGVWPFSRYPQLLDRGETMFRRNAFKSILVARYVGAIRPFVPAIAGMAHMPLHRYAQASGAACLSWAVLFLLPGWMLGQAYDAVAAVAGRLFVVVALLGVILGLVWALVLYGYRWSAARIDIWLARLLGWSQRHPLLGRYSVAVFDPQRRESVPLAMLAAMLLLLGWGWFALLMAVMAHGEPLRLDLAVHEAMLALRNPLADYPLAALASLGDWQVLLPAIGAGMGYLMWRRRWMAAAHWLAALAFGLALTKLLGATMHVVRPPAASSGFGFPSVAVTMATITFGFFAVLIARELPGRTRVWPYLVSGIIVTSIGFARIYLGAHWLSDVIGGMLFGLFWLLVLGIAYRRRFNRSFWVKPVAWLFYGSFALAAFWYAPRNIPLKLAKFEPAPPVMMQLDASQWWEQDWRHLPSRRNEFDDDQRWPLDVQVAGPLAPLQRQLESRGWRAQPQAGWEQALLMLDVSADADEVPVLPATLDTHVESLLMLRPGDAPGELHALRLWPAPAQLAPQAAPLWLGSAQTLRYQRHFRLFGLWRPLRGIDPALNAVKESLGPLPNRSELHPDTRMPMLLVRSEPVPPAG